MITAAPSFLATAAMRVDVLHFEGLRARRLEIDDLGVGPHQLREAFAPIIGSKKVVSTPKFLSVVLAKRRAGP